MMIAFFAMAFSATMEAKPEFKVLASKGKIMVQRSSSGWETLSYNSKLFETDKIKIPDGGYLGIVHSSGRTVELKQSGEFSVSDLVKKISSKKGTASERLTDYVFDEMSQADDLLASDDYHNSMEITGSVERSISDDIFAGYEEDSEEGRMAIMQDRRPVIIKSPHKTNLLDSEIAFVWYRIPEAEEYVLTLRDRFDREVFTRKIMDTAVSVNLYDYNLEQDVYYFWNVMVAEKPGIKSDDCAFLLLPDEKVENIEREIANLCGSDSERSAIDKIMLGAFFEKNDLYFEAMKAYEGAIELVPEVESYRKMYEAFLYKVRTNY